MYYTAQDIANLGTILGIWAHPDDEAFASSGLMAIACANGQRVVTVTATKGDAGKSADEERWPCKDLAIIRTRELEASLQAVGDVEHYWLDYKDGSLHEVSDDSAVESLADLFSRVQPDTLVTFEPQGITGHEDHKAVHRWAVALRDRLAIQSRVLCATECQEYYEKYGKKLDEEHNVYFNIDKPNLVNRQSADLCVQMDEQIQMQKYRAIAAHASQTSAMLASEEGRAAIRCLCECECFNVI